MHMKQKAVLIIMAFILMFLPLAIPKGLNAGEVAPEVLSDNVQPLDVQGGSLDNLQPLNTGEVSLDEVKAFSDSFKWNSLDTRKLALYAIEMIPKEHQAVAMEKLKTALQKNAANSPNNQVSKDLLFKSVNEIVPPKILTGVLKILRKAD